jgi:Acyl-ACP thioesterase
MEKYVVDKIVSYQDIDFSGKIKLSSLFSILSEVATEHALLLGVWDHSMIDNYGWILAKMYIEINKPIIYEEKIRIRTWPSINSKVVFPRYYELLNENSDIIAVVSSVWTLLDLRKRRIAIPSRVGIKFPDNLIDEISTSLPDDIIASDKLEYLSKRKVVYSDLDTNLHVNNARYIEWVCDLLDFRNFEEGFINRLTIQFRKEIKFGTIVYFYIESTDESFIVYGSDELGLNHYFEVSGYWEKERR